MKPAPLLVICISGSLFYQLSGHVHGGGPDQRDPRGRDDNKRELLAQLMSVQQKAYAGEITFEQAQRQIDEWAREIENDPDRSPFADFANLNTPPAGQTHEVPPQGDGGALKEAGAELARLVHSALNGLESPHERQAKIDSAMRSPAGKQALEAHSAAQTLAAASENALTSPLVVEVPENASSSEVAAMDPREQIAQVLVNVRSQNAMRPLHEIQAAIDNRMSELKPQFESITEHFNAAQKEQLAQAQEALRESALDTEEQPAYQPEQSKDWFFANFSGQERASGLEQEG